jgi:hypothetical protein
MPIESNQRKPRFWVLTLALLLLCVGREVLFGRPAGSGPATSALGSPGTIWGGEHLGLQVAADGASLDFDCATGTITGALVPDAQGKFMIGGTLVRERPGPTMRGGNPTLPAKYSGTIQGERLRLVVSVEGSKDPYGEYELVRGKSGRVLKCR